MWYEKSFRRHLCDMHIEDWDDEFLKYFSPEKYVENLKLANVQTAILYFQSHVGYCYFPTKSGHMHAAFRGREDMMQRVVNLCHKGGMTVVGYYSLIYNNWAYYAHPEWRLIDVNGKTDIDNGRRYGYCCPNNKEYREFLKEQIKEISEYFDFDLMFYDMPFWPYACYCPSCRERWEREEGGSLPVVNSLRDEMALKHIRKHQQWMGEFAAYVTDLTKRFNGNVPVEFNLANTLAFHRDDRCWCTPLVNESCEYAGGDLYGGIWKQSMACKYFNKITKNHPFEYMTSRCNPNLSNHTVTKSYDQLLATAMMTCAHHGATQMIDAINPNGTMNPAVYERIGKVFEAEQPYEPYLTGEFTADTAVFINSYLKTNLDGEEFDSHTSSANLCRTLIENHITHDIVTNGFLDGIDNYKALFVPYAACLEDSDVDALLKYVENGGILYFSGAEEPKLLKTLFKAQKTGYTDEDITYLAPKAGYEDLFFNYSAFAPLPFLYRLPVVEGFCDEDVLAYITLPYTNPKEKRFSSIHSNPPGRATNIPAFAFKAYGKGFAIWSAAPIEDENIYDYRRIMMNILYSAVPKEELMLETSAPRNVELTMFRDNDSLLLHAVQVSDEYELSDINRFTISLKCEREPLSIELLPDHQPVPFSFADGRATFNVEGMKAFKMFKITENKVSK